MSTLLYALGRWSFVHRWRVLLGWFLIAVVVGASAATLGSGFRDTFTLPGSESQEALSTLQRTFPELSGASAQMIVKVPQGRTVNDPDVRKSIESTLRQIRNVNGVQRTISPYDDLIKGSTSTDQRAAISQIQFSGGLGEIKNSDLEQMTKMASSLRSGGATVEFGGSAFTRTGPPLSVNEAVGIVVAFLVLLIALGAVRPALLPLVSSIFGVAITTGIIYALTGAVVMSPTTPLLALMIGLAVGIDYALFVMWRQREELAGGATPEESAARAVATAGSAVVFAGLTVMIALAGLVVVGIPFLAVMGLTAAGGVAVSVVVTLTMVPALLGFAGERVMRKRRSASRHRVALSWVRTATRWPLLTVAAVVMVLGVVALPARELALALPDNGVTPADTTERKAYDLIDKEFGPGYNAPLLVEADIVESTDPLGLMRDLSDDIAKIPGVKLIALSTPNRNADTGIVQLIPTTGADEPATTALVNRLRAASSQFERDHGVKTYVTGQTALQIDVSDKLHSSLIPFGILVVGLSLILLMAVFRSLLVPVKAAVGYLLSVGAAVGTIVTVFQWGWCADFLHVERLGPVVSFLPIILMGVLFGLAMDYEVFLVSRMKEEFARTGAASSAITNGFVSSSSVVTAAAVIMIAVFASFVPEGNASVKPIALGLAVGVTVDAFVVRMIFVPAVLRLFGNAAWTLPAWLDRVLPNIDIEGDGLRHRLELENWPSNRSELVIAAEQVLIEASGRHRPRLTANVARDQWLLVTGSDREHRTGLLLAVAGRRRVLEGRLRVADHLLPYETRALRSEVTIAEIGGFNDMDPRLTVAEQVADSATFARSSRPTHQTIKSFLASLERAVVAAGVPASAVPSAEEFVGDLTPVKRALLGIALAMDSVPTIVVVDLDLLPAGTSAQPVWAVLAELTRESRTSVVAMAQTLADAHPAPHLDQVVVVDLDQYTPTVARRPELVI